MAIRGIIFDLGWTLLDFAGDIQTVEVERARDLGEFLRDNGFDLDGADVFASYREEMRALWKTGAIMNYEYPARLAMLRSYQVVDRTPELPEEELLYEYKMMRGSTAATVAAPPKNFPPGFYFRYVEPLQ